MTDWPPAPDDLKTSTLRSFGSIFMSTSSASGSTATETVEVCTLPEASVTGTLCTLWTPDSNFIFRYTPFPSIPNTTSLNPPASDMLELNISTFQPWPVAYLEYILKRSVAKSDASRPPVPARISTIIFLSARGSSSRSRSSIFFSSSGLFFLRPESSSFAISANSASADASEDASCVFLVTRASSSYISASIFLYSRYLETIFLSEANSFV